MSQGPTGQRPGGLTALAIINFIFGGFASLGLLGKFALIGCVNVATGGQVNRAIPYMALIYVSLVVGLISVVLLITSGVGYLQQQRVLGKILGSVYGIVGILYALTGAIGEQDFGIGDLINLVYPVLTLVLLNTVFKDDFLNR